jgi:hypothetical protein
MTKQITELAQHIVLYSKGWYKKSPNHIEDLKTLLSKYSLLDIKYVSDCDIYNIVADAFVEVCDQRQYRELLRRFFYKPLSKPEPRTMLESIHTMLMLMSYIQVRNKELLLIDLGKPDYTLLPKAEYPTEDK